MTTCSSWTYKITLVEASQLIAADRNGLSDPYVEAGFVSKSGSSWSQKFRSRTVYKTLNPKWEKDSFEIVSDSPSTAILFKVWDENAIKKSVPLGEATLELAPEEYRGPGKETWLTLLGVASGRLLVHAKLAASSVRSAEESADSQLYVDKKKHKTMIQRLESLTGKDFDGDGIVGPAAPVNELALLRAENKLLKEALERHGVPAAELGPTNRMMGLALEAEKTRHRLRLVQAEIIDTAKEIAVNSVHTSGLLTSGELSVKRSMWGSISDVASMTSVRVDWSRWPSVPFGAPMRTAHFHVPENYLNCSSYGATAKAVMEAAEMWRTEIARDPVMFAIKSRPVCLNKAAVDVCRFLGADPNDFHWMPNANTATSTVLKSFAWQPGDRLLLLSCEYEATLHAAEWLRAHHGVEPYVVDLQLPLTADEIVDEVERALRALQASPPMPRLANFCHVTSRTAYVFPAARLTALLHRYKVPVCIDGAQAPGHIPLNVNAIGAEYYIGTLHKWVYTPQGVAFIVAKPHCREGLTPLTVSYYHGQGYQSEFSYCGLVDFAPFLAVSQALKFVKHVCGGWSSVWAYGRDFACKAVDILEAKWGTKVFQRDPECYARMPLVPIPNGTVQTRATASALMAYLAAKKITVLMPRIKIKGIDTICVRVSCQVFNELAEVHRLADAILELKGDYSTLQIAAGVMKELSLW
eukprot:m51a1_g8944 putative class v aminotransferase (696) ;mRNA; r:982298-985155